MELDPNDTYKSGFRELTANLGRLPTMAELLPLNIAYARSWAPAEETVLAPVSAAGPGETSPSRQPAPRARAIPSITRTSEDQEALYATHKSSQSSEAESVLPPTPGPSRDSQRVIVGRRGPGGGIMATCRRCHASFERPARKGRPPVECETCRD